jgi:hypothetical protein
MSPRAALRFFISYSTHAAEDVILADYLATELSNRGHDTFLDTKLPAGVRWSEEIERSLENSNRFVVLLSKNSIKRDMVAEEVRRAYARAARGSFTILPVRVRFQGKLPFEMGAHLGAYQAIPWNGPQDNELVVAKLLGAGSSSDRRMPRENRWPADDPVAMLREIDGMPVTPALVPIKLIRAVAEACTDRAEATMIVQQAEAWLLEAGEFKPGVMLRLDPQFLPDIRDNPLNYWLQTFTRAATRGARVLVALLAALPPNILATHGNSIASTLNAAKAGLGEVIVENS